MFAATAALVLLAGCSKTDGANQQVQANNQGVTATMNGGMPMNNMMANGMSCSGASCGNMMGNSMMNGMGKAPQSNDAALANEVDSRGVVVNHAEHHLNETDR
jgi:hypothetical protein